MNFSQATLYLLAGTGVVLVAGSIYAIIYSNYAELERNIRRRLEDYAQELYDYLDRMFIRIPLSRCYLMILVPTITFSFIGFVVGLQLSFVLGCFAAVVCGFFGFKTPRTIISGWFKRRVQKFDRQLVDALNMMSNAVKSGLSFMQVIQVIEREMPDPCAEEFGMVLKENRVGVNLNDALLNMTKRIPSEDLFMIINSVVTLSQQGGDLSEAFDTIAKTIRERQRVSDKIRTLAQAGITQGFILSLIPIVMLGLQWFIQPNYVRLLFTTNLGVVFLLIMVGMIIAGAFWMRKILTIDI